VELIGASFLAVRLVVAGLVVSLEAESDVVCMSGQIARRVPDEEAKKNSNVVADGVSDGWRPAQALTGELIGRYAGPGEYLEGGWWSGREDSSSR